MGVVFSGLRIVDFTEGIAGPLAAMPLGDFGAEVWKIERARGDRFADRPAHRALNRNKCRLILGGAASRASLDALIAGADVLLVDHATPSMLRSEGLDAERLCARHPRLIHVWLPPYGPDERHASLPPSDLLLSALTGTAFSQFSWEDVPVYLVTPQLSYAQGLLGAVGIAAALFERLRSGLGQSVVVSGFEGLALTRGGTAGKVGEMDRRAPQGALGNSPSYRLYRCADGEWLFLGTLLLPHLRLALEALGVLDLLALPQVGGRIERLRSAVAAPLVRARLEALFLEADRAHWLERLVRAGVPCGPVGDRASWFESEAVRAVDMRCELPDGSGGVLAIPGVSARLSECPGGIHAPLRDATWSDVVPRVAPTVAAPPAAPPSDAPPSAAPLAGVRVLDLGAIIAGPFSTCLLASLGAEVIKVEPPGGDAFRTYGRAFVGYNQGKRSIELDLRDAAQHATFLELARRSDVVCDNYRVGVLERLGIDHASLSSKNPRIVCASVTAYGTRGPFAHSPGFDPLLQARSGLMREQGGDDEPVFHQIPINDVASAAVIAFGIITALIRREQTGRGQRVETSLTAQSVLTQLDEMTAYAGRPAAVRGSRDCPGVRALERFYACIDGWLAIVVNEPAQLAALCESLGLPPAGTSALTEPRDGVFARSLELAFAARKREEILARLAAKGVPAAPARTYQELLSSPELMRPDFFVTWDLPEHGPTRSIRRFVYFSRTPSELCLRAPLSGEHSQELIESLSEQ